VNVEGLDRAALLSRLQHGSEHGIAVGPESWSRVRKESVRISAFASKKRLAVLARMQ
jgi:hypothetical protein